MSNSRASSHNKWNKPRDDAQPLSEEIALEKALVKDGIYLNLSLLYNP